MHTQSLLSGYAPGVYDMRIVLLKWNGQMLMKWLLEQFFRCCLCLFMSSFSETKDKHHTALQYE